MSDNASTNADTDDTTGHVLHGDAAKNPTGGGQMPSVAIRAGFGSDDDDVAGHRYIANATGEPTADDDVDGHRQIAAATDEPSDDDVEGHRYIAAATGEPSDDDVEGHRQITI